MYGGATYKPFTLERDCKAIQVPSGEVIILKEGTQGMIMQSLGGSHTVTTDQGMVRIDGRDADAIGLEVKPEDIPRPPASTKKEDIEKAVWDRLKSVYDPEIPVNVVELGLIYECGLIPLSAEDEYRVDIKMTLTAPGCGMGDVLVRDAQLKIEEIPGIKETNIQLVLDPPWEKSMMSDAAQLQLGMF